MTREFCHPDVCPEPGPERSDSVVEEEVEEGVRGGVEVRSWRSYLDL